MSRRPQREPAWLAPHLDGMQVRVNNVPRKPAPTASAPIVPVLAQMLNHGRRLPPEPKGGTNDEAAAKREADLKRKIDAQKRGLRRQGEKIKRLQNELQALNVEIVSRTREALNHDVRANALQRELSATRTRLEEKEAEFEASKALHAEAVRVQGEVQSMAAEVEKLEREAAEYRAEAAAAQMRLQEENGRVAELEAKLARLIGENDAASEAAASELASARVEKQSMEQRNQILKEGLEQEKARADSADARSHASRAEAQKWEREFRALRLQKERVSRAAAENAKRREDQDKRIEVLEEELRQAKKLVLEQQGRLVEAEQQALEMSTASAQLQEALSAEVATAKATASSSAQQNLQLQARLRTTSAADRLQLVHLQSDVDKWSKMYEQEKQLYILKERECEEANRERKGAWEQVRAVNVQLEDKEREHARLKYELATVRAELQATEKKDDQISKELNRLRLMLRNSEARIQSEEEANTALQQLQQRQAESFEARLAMAEEGKERLQQELARLQQERAGAFAPDSDAGSGEDDVEMKTPTNALFNGTSWREGPLEDPEE